MSNELLSQATEVLRWYATRSGCGCGCDREIHKDAGKRARKVLLSMGIPICDACRSEPSEHERKRIDDDLRFNGCFAQPSRWLCPACAPCLRQSPSGLCWEVLEISMSSSVP